MTTELATDFHFGRGPGFSLQVSSFPLEQDPSLPPLLLLQLVRKSVGRSDLAQLARRAGIIAEDGWREDKIVSLPAAQRSDAAASFCLRAIPVVSLADAGTVGSRILLPEDFCRDEVPESDRDVRLQVDIWALDQILDAMSVRARCSWAAVAVSSEAIASQAFRDFLKMRLSADPLLAGRICLEVSERSSTSAPLDVDRFLRFASELGCQTGLRDFTGHLPLKDLVRSNRLDWISLSEPMVRGALAKRRKLELLRTIAAEAVAAGLSLRAENLAPSADLNILKRVGVKAVDGESFGQVLPWPDGLDTASIRN